MSQQLVEGAVPTTIAASNYEKQEFKLENINKRQKRSNIKNKINATKIVIKTEKDVYSDGVVFNNKVYFGSYDHNVYEYDPITEQQKIVIKTNGKIAASGLVLNNKLYFGSEDHNVYEYDPNYYNLGQINNNDNNLILNELNYLNPELDISQLQIINKTNNSAIVKEKNNLDNDNKLEIYYSINNEQNKVITLNELIKKAIFFKFRDENITFFFKEITDIDIDNLNFENVEVTKNKNLDWNVDFKNVCFNQKVRKNASSIIKSIIIPKCEYNRLLAIPFFIKIFL